MADIPPPPPPPPQQSPPPPYQPPPLQPGMAPPPGSPGYMPPPIGPQSTGIPVGTQLRLAAWPIIIGVAGILLPVISGVLLNGNVYYFFVLPIFGVIYSVRLLGRRVWIGGGAGLVLNVLAGLASLSACGAINPGGQ
jgi:hypothetical protein